MKYLKLRLSAAMWARVLLLWLMLGIGGLAVGAFAIGLGNFVQTNVRNELIAQQITFTAADALSDDERALPGLLENAGLPLSTGNQAQAYAGLIGLHMSHSAADAGYPDASYATLGAVQRRLRADVAAATEAGDNDALEAAQTELTAVTNLRNTLQTGNVLRGTLFSAYGWDNVATGMMAAGGVVLVLALVFFVLFIYEWWRGHLPPAEA